MPEEPKELIVELPRRFTIDLAALVILIEQAEEGKPQEFQSVVRAQLIEPCYGEELARSLCAADPKLMILGAEIRKQNTCATATWRDIHETARQMVEHDEDINKDNPDMEDPEREFGQVDHLTTTDYAARLSMLQDELYAAVSAFYEYLREQYGFVGESWIVRHRLALQAASAPQ